MAQPGHAGHREDQRLTSAAAQRWLISMRVGRSSGGNHSPSQRGQWSPQPMPEPVMRDDPSEHDEAKGQMAPVQASRRSRRVLVSIGWVHEGAIRYWLFAVGYRPGDHEPNN